MDQPIDAEVVLTANNTQYDQAMQSSASATDVLAASVDSLTKKINDLSKSAGRKLVGIAAADVAIITGATAAYAAYEQQMSRLQAQAAIVTRSRDAEKKTMESYTAAVDGLRKTYGTTVSEGSKLVETISKITGRNTQRELKATSDTFVAMSKATGESSTGLATSVLNLQKIMGTNTAGSGVTKKYADQITYLSQQTNLSAQGLAEFTAQLAPVGRLLELNQTQVTGMATAFAKAGQDGYAAANTFSQLTTNIAYAAQTGSPELSKYANLVNMTVEQFKSLEGSEQIIKVMEAISAGGPKVITDLNRMGLDGMRTVRTMTALMSQSGGGIRDAIRESQMGFDSDATGKGAAASMKGMVDELQNIRSDIASIAEEIGKPFAEMVTKILQGVGSLTSGLNELMQGPFGAFMTFLGTGAGAAAAFAGSVLLMAGALSKLALGAMVLRGSPMRGFLEGRAGMGSVGGAGPMGTTGQQVAANGSWLQRMGYNAGNVVGRGTSGLLPPGGGPPLWQRAAAMPGNVAAWGMRNLLAPIYSPLGVAGYNDPTRRIRMFDSPRFLGSAPFQWFNQGRIDFNERMYSRQGYEGPRMPGGQYASEAAAAAARASATTAVSRESGVLSRMFANLTRSSGTLAAAMSSAALNTARLGAGVIGGGIGAVGNKIGWGNIGMAAGAGLLMTGAGANTGLQNTLAMGLMGGMAGPWGAGIGAGVGLVMDASKTNNDFEEAAKTFDTVQRKSDSLAELDSSYDDMLEEYNKLSDKLSDGAKWHSAFTNFTASAANAKNMVEGLFGKSDSEEAFDKANAQYADLEASKGAATGLADATDVKLVGDYATQMQKLDEVIMKLKPNMDELGITFEDLKQAFVASQADMDNPAVQGLLGLMGGGKYNADDYQKMIDQITSPGKSTGLWDRIARTNYTGATFMGSQDVKSALALPEDVNLQYRAINSTYSRLLRDGATPLGVVRQSGDVLAQGMTADDPEYILNQAILDKAKQTLGYQQPFMGRSAGYQQQANLFATQANTMAGDPNQMEKMEEAQAGFIQNTMQQVQYFQQLLYQQREFNVSQARAQEDFGRSRARMDEEYGISRRRAQADFHLQRMYQEQDYQLSRRRAEEDYNLSRERGQYQFTLSMTRGQEDFNTSRLRQEQDYNHQVVLMAEQAAQQMYNIYERMRVQRTSSASYMLVNAQDQLEQMRNQSSNLDRVRGMGLSDDAIQQLGLTDSNNAQQLSRFVAEAANNPQIIEQFNTAIKERLGAARELVTDESSKDWEEFQRQYELSRTRATADFEKSVKRARKDFRLQMQQMEDDFQKSMSRSATDYETAQERQQKAFSLSMSRGAEDYGRAVRNMSTDFATSMARAKEDMDRMAEEISGSMTEILVRATKELNGKSATQARLVLGTFSKLRTELGVEGNDIMTQLAEIFGFKYTPVENPGGGRRTNKFEYDMGPGGRKYADGGVLPGRSIGRDDMHFFSPKHGALSLAGGEAIMVPEWVDQVGGPQAVKKMNEMARRGFAAGGTIPAVGGWHQHEGGYPWARWAGDINVPGSGDYGNPVRSYKDGVIALVNRWNYSYGNHIRVNHPKTDEQTLYAHLSAISVKPGDSVVRGQQIGRVGSTGNSSGPHLHFEIMGGTGPVMLGSGAAGVAIGMSLADVLKDEYPNVERAAGKVKIGGGFERGSWSNALNRMAKLGYRHYTSPNPDNHEPLSWYGHGGIFADPNIIGVGEKGPEMVLPLDDRGAMFIADIMQKMHVGSEGKASHLTGGTPIVTHTINTYQIDRSTTFSGNITVAANNPAEFIQQMQQRQRIQALSQAALGGKR